MITADRGLGVPARAVNGAIAWWIGRLGLPLPRLALLRVHGRRTGRLHEVPVLIAHSRGSRYLVAPRGRTDWARNLAAAGWGELRYGRRTERVEALAVEGPERLRAIGAYLRTYGVMTRRLFGLPRRPSADRIAAVAPAHPTFRIRTRDDRMNDDGPPEGGPS